jgi:hypothetical protein
MSSQKKHHSKIVSKNKHMREQIDIHLKKIASLNANIGLDSTATEKQAIKHLMQLELKAIKELDKEFYEVICPDKKDKV